MKCDKCAAQATVHLTEIIKGVKKEHHLCETCAREMGAFIDNQFTVADLLGKLAAPVAGKTEPEAPGLDLTCPDCRLTFAQFRQVGRLGCPSCYKAFEEPLAQLFEKIHGATRHVGKIPSRANRSVEVESRVHAMRQNLQEIIQREQFEEAAKLRDEISMLEKGLAGGGD